MDRKAFSFLIVGLALGVLLTTAAFAWYVHNGRLNSAVQHSRVLKLAHGLDENHPVHHGMEHMAERVAELSGGRLAIQIFPNEQLGNETECIEQLQRGALAMTKVSVAPLESFTPKLSVFGMPFLFRDDAHHWKVLEGPIGRELLLASEENGVRGLCYYDAGSRSFYTAKRPILTPDDLKGMKIRVQQSKTAMDMVEVLGGSPTPIAFGELYTALQQGMVDGAENNVPSFHSTRHYEVCKHLSLDRHTQVPDILLISTQVWENLTPEEQQWLQQAADDSSRYQRGLWAEETEKALAAVKEHGVTVYEPDRQPFIERAEAMHRRYDGTELGDMMQRIEEVR